MTNLEMAKNIPLNFPRQCLSLSNCHLAEKIISNGKNNSQLQMDSFVISRFAIIEEIVSVYIMEVMKSKELLVEAGTKG